MTVFTPGGAADLGFVIPLTKIDAEKRMIYGVAAQGGVVDKAKEIMDYASAKPQFQSWSSEFERATNGLSKGNLRVMHTKTVAGTIPEISFDDDQQLIKIGAHVVDDGEWRKCLAGAYTGFSVGGGYLKKWTDADTGCTRYTPIVREMSLVDNPCIPTARFAELVKANGIVEQLPLRGVIRTFADQWQTRPRGFAEQWEMQKAFDESKHPRDHGKFASEGGSVKRYQQATGGSIGETIGTGIGILGGYFAGKKLARPIAAKFAADLKRKAEKHGLGLNASKLRAAAEGHISNNLSLIGASVGSQILGYTGKKIGEASSDKKKKRGDKPDPLHQFITGRDLGGVGAAAGYSLGAWKGKEIGAAIGGGVYGIKNKLRNGFKLGEKSTALITREAAEFGRLGRNIARAHGFMAGARLAPAIGAIGLGTLGFRAGYNAAGEPVGRAKAKNVDDLAVQARRKAAG